MRRLFALVAREKKKWNEKQKVGVGEAKKKASLLRRLSSKQ